MAMKNLVEGECGVSNSLLKFTGHFTEDKAFKQEGFYDLPRYPDHKVEKPLALPRDVEWVDEFLHAQNTQAAPETFHMGSLLQEMRQIEEAELFHEPQTAPAIADLAVSSEWAKDFLASESTQNSDMGASASATDSNSSAVRWAAEYLDPVHANKDWSQEHEKNQSYQPEDVRRAAQELVDSLNNPRIEDTESAKSLVDQWQEEFTKEMGSETISDEQFWENLQKHWEDVDRNVTDGHPWLTEYTDSELYQDYKFASENPLLQQKDPFNAGLEKLKKGDIPNAVLLFEAAVQKDASHAEAWQYLGTTQAENEREPAAIAALKKCLELQPDNLTAWMAIAVSYTNEYQQLQACSALKSWLAHNPQYSHLAPISEIKPGSASTASSMASKNQMMEIRDLYIEAARLSPNKIDPDVQCGLGVLFNLSGDLSKAVDCFNAALQARPNDAQLWNKLGASLANSNKSEQAVEAYHQALQLSPGFIRSRYNLGIACINLGVHQSAIEHFLVALNMQRKSEDLMPASMNTSRQVMSMNIWGTLRMTLTIMNRMDLHDACDKFDLELLNREFNMNS
ncbi:peroxisomal targeting signal 1 receptor-like isoform X2 [Octopus vulgaris]|uniref:Peroxisomal targeting signal 1 receptor-like isoform X2 n=2 Tax=Octopus TaxID=6643 RepID=A0AA36BUT0_OCTVU|nr:peroxisomal targeting signal 1 receptor isoform X2 [Octopus sinensis]CAI9740986.1 peroxisomal targeting signal 1 receptor-like isoform X2 [Octopus vulgaris]